MGGMFMYVGSGLYLMQLYKLAGPMRAALAGRAATPSVFDMMLVLGREESLARLGDAACEKG